MTKNIVNPAQDMLEIKCHDDYKWAALKINELEWHIEKLEADKKQGAKRIKEMKTGYAQYEARIKELEEENRALQGSYNAAMRRIDLLERGRER